MQRRVQQQRLAVVEVLHRVGPDLAGPGLVDRQRHRRRHVVQQGEAVGRLAVVSAVAALLPARLDLDRDDRIGAENQRFEGGAGDGHLVFVIVGHEQAARLCGKAQRIVPHRADGGDIRFVVKRRAGVGDYLAGRIGVVPDIAQRRDGRAFVAGDHRKRGQESRAVQIGAFLARKQRPGRFAVDDAVSPLGGQQHAAGRVQLGVQPVFDRPVAPVEGENRRPLVVQLAQRVVQRRGVQHRADVQINARFVVERIYVAARQRDAHALHGGGRKRPRGERIDKIGDERQRQTNQNAPEQAVLAFFRFHLRFVHPFTAVVGIVISDCLRWPS